jgi:cell division protein FtsW (lipid II flippase)
MIGAIIVIMMTIVEAVIVAVIVTVVIAGAACRADLGSTAVTVTITLSLTVTVTVSVTVPIAVLCLGVMIAAAMLGRHRNTEDSGANGQNEHPGEMSYMSLHCICVLSAVRFSPSVQ